MVRSVELGRKERSVATPSVKEDAEKKLSQLVQTGHAQGEGIGFNIGSCSERNQ